MCPSRGSEHPELPRRRQVRTESEFVQGQSHAARLLLQEGPEVLVRLHPSQWRDKTAFLVGEAVSRDGVMFDPL